MTWVEPLTRRTHLYVGCYTHASPIGIRVYDSSDPNGVLIERSEVEGVEHPSFLAAHPNGRVLYAVSETVSPSGGEVAAFRIDPADGSLTMLDRVSSRGDAPCYISVDRDGRHLYVANYLSGTVAVFTVASDGRFCELVTVHQHQGSGPTSRQEGPHAHCIMAGPHGDSVYAVDLGTDRVIQYKHGGRHQHDMFAPTAQLALEAGTGPRHLAFHPTEPVAFLVGELNSTLATIAVEPDTGRLTVLGVCSTLPAGFDGR